ncbi:MAG: DUF354 domain-containing protein [Methanosarcina sp.]|nr:DUF354 domain-containing protein [Methanosarcina sp.]
MAHPSQVHQFKYTIRDLEDKGHKCKITIVDKEVSIKLLEAYGFEYEVVGSAKSSLLLKSTELLKIESQIYKISSSFKPDLLVGGSGNAYVAHVGKLIRKPSIIFEDSENALIERLLTDPFATVICTPTSFKKNLGFKQVLFDGYKELAYLHPKHFCPNPIILDELGLSNEDKLIIMRFVNWNANHDVGHHGIQNEIELVQELEKYGRVLITSERNVDPELEKYKIKTSPEKLHDLLFFAHLFIGDSQTMTTEAAVLGIPAIRCNSFVGKNDMSNFVELEQKYHLIYNYCDSTEALMKAIELMKNSHLKDEWENKRDSLLKDKIDVSSFITWFIENYPESFIIMKENPDFQSQFKTV